MRALSAVVMFALLALPATAQDNHHQLAVRAVEAGFEPRYAALIMDSFWPVAIELIKQRVPGLTEPQLFNYRGKTLTFADETAHAALVPLVDLFEKGFSDEELQAVIAFYESPAGLKLNGAQEIIAGVMDDEVNASLKVEIRAFQQKIDAMLAADGY